MGKFHRRGHKDIASSSDESECSELTPAKLRKMRSKIDSKSSKQKKKRVENDDSTNYSWEDSGETEPRSNHPHPAHSKQSPFVYKDHQVKYAEDVPKKTPLVLGHRCESQSFSSSSDHSYLFKVNGTALIEQLQVKNLDSMYPISENDIYVVSDNPSAITSVTLLPTEMAKYIYCNSIAGEININLGTVDNFVFEDNRSFIFKDLSLSFSSAGSAYNINITAPSNVKIEYYNNGVLSQDLGGSYSIDSNGGLVTFTYVSIDLPGFTPTWVITNQFVGSARS